jgi:hypothetical protein
MEQLVRAFGCEPAQRERKMACLLGWRKRLRLIFMCHAACRWVGVGECYYKLSWRGLLRAREGRRGWLRRRDWA